MFIINYLKSFFEYFSIFQKKCTVVLLGLDNAGKTTFLHRLKEDRMTIHDPTLYAHSEEIKLGNLLFKIVDVGGHKAMRKIWKNFYMNTDAIIFIVDAADSQRINEVKEELNNILVETNAKSIPILIMGNKIDMRTAMSEEGLMENLGVKEQLTATNKRKVALFMCSIAKKLGYREGLLWLDGLLK